MLPSPNLPITNFRKAKFCVITHNLGGFNFSEVSNLQDLSKKIKSNFYSDYPQVADNDIIIIGVQEIVEVKSKNYKKIMFGAEDDYKELASFFSKKFPKFLLFFKNFNGPNGILVFIKKSSKKSFDLYIDKVHRINLGFMGFASNKCIIGIELYVNNAKYLFFNGHLAAGEKKQHLQKRMNNLKSLNSLLSMKSCLFWQSVSYLLIQIYLIFKEFLLIYFNCNQRKKSKMESL